MNLLIMSKMLKKILRSAAYLVTAVFILTLVGDLKDMIQAQPEFSVQLAESILVILPATEEIHGAILSSLDHRPSWGSEIKGQRSEVRAIRSVNLLVSL